MSIIISRPLFLHRHCRISLGKKYQGYKGGNFDTLVPAQNGRHFVDDIFKSISLNKCNCIFISPKDSTESKWSLIQSTNPDQDDLHQNWPEFVYWRHWVNGHTRLIALHRCIQCHYFLHRSHKHRIIHICMYAYIWHNDVVPFLYNQQWSVIPSHTYHPTIHSASVPTDNACQTATHERQKNWIMYEYWGVKADIPNNTLSVSHIKKAITSYKQNGIWDGIIFGYMYMYLILYPPR